jgi:TM2 domain-containing membrane protein YozV
LLQSGQANQAKGTSDPDKWVSKMDNVTLIRVISGLMMVGVLPAVIVASRRIRPSLQYGYRPKALASELELVNQMSETQRYAFMFRRKNATTAFLLCFFLGGIGAHKFYLGRMGEGVVYLLFFWTLIPGIFALCELFTISRQVDRCNAEIAAFVMAIMPRDEVPA